MPQASRDAVICFEGWPSSSLSSLLSCTSSALDWVTGAAAAEDGPAKRAVIVSGPVHSLTVRYRGYAKAMADAAEAQGMDVKRVFHPNAPKSRVKKLANGADLLIYVGHGNGWPSNFGPFQEDTKNGLGLDPEDPDKRGPNTVVYKGANWLRENIALAPNAVVILSHLSYASGNASSGMPIPSRSVAVERVDNFANGFLDIGAQVVWALGWQPGKDVIDALYSVDSSMDDVFRTRYRSNVNPLNGWIGEEPGYYASERVPGATVHIDPSAQYGYLRAITGNLDYTTTQWRDGVAPPPDEDPPVISDVSASQASTTLATGDSGPAVFTPNGDGLSDTIGIDFRLSENAFLEMAVKRDGNVVMTRTAWVLKGKGRLSWDGKRDDRTLVSEGEFRVVLTPTDRAGNVGESGKADVLVLNSMKKPRVAPNLFFAADEDELGQSSVFNAKLTRGGTISWIVRDAAGSVVRRAVDGVEYPAGPARYVWDGKDDAGNYVPKGRYTARIRIDRPKGSYAHDVTVRHMPFKMRTDAWKIKRGATAILFFEAAEPVAGKPEVTAKQPGLNKYALKVTKLGPSTFKARLESRKKGRAGEMKIRVAGTDKGDGRQWQVFKMRVR